MHGVGGQRVEARALQLGLGLGSRDEETASNLHVRFHALQVLSVHLHHILAVGVVLLPDFPPRVSLLGD